MVDTAKLEAKAPGRRRRRGPRRGAYDAFISYSHAADTDLAPALRDGLHKLAKPWYRLRATRVFLDETSMAANPGLWSTLTGMLTNTEYFILLASPEAAASPWVQKEVGWWCANKPPARLLIGLTRRRSARSPARTGHT